MLMYRIRDYLSICCQKQRSTDPLIAKRSKINVKLNAIIFRHLIGYDLLHADRCLQLISNSTRLIGNCRHLRLVRLSLPHPLSRPAIVATLVSFGYRCHGYSCHPRHNSSKPCHLLVKTPPHRLFPQTAPHPSFVASPQPTVQPSTR